MHKNNSFEHHSIHILTAGLLLAALGANSAAANPTITAEAGPPTATNESPKKETSMTRRERLEESSRQYQQASDSQLHTEAADAAKRYIGHLLSDPNFNKMQWGNALERLGNAQYLAGDYAAAIENFSLSVNAIETEENRLHEALAKPLHGLGLALHTAGMHREAIDAYKRLLHVSQVNSGLHTLEQAEAVNELSNIYLELGDHERANALQQSFVSIYTQNFPDDELQQLPALYSRADMYSKTGRMLDSQLSYRRIISMIEREAGSQSLTLLPAIYRIADLMQNNQIMDGADGSYKARRFLRRAVYIAEKHEAASNLDRADAYIAMGNFYSLQTGDRRAAMRNYVAAWEQLQSDPTLAAELDKRFALPTLLNDVPARSSPAMRKLMTLSKTELDDFFGLLAVRYDIDEHGRTHNIEMIEGDPAGYWDPIVVDHVSKLIFRPAITDGLGVGAEDRRYEIRYSTHGQEMQPDLRQNGLGKQVSYQTE